MGTRGPPPELIGKAVNIGEIWRGLNVGLKGGLGPGFAAVMQPAGGDHRDYAERDENGAGAALGATGGLERAANFCVSHLRGQELGGMCFVDVAMVVSHGMEGGLGGSVFGGLFVGPVAACGAQAVPTYSEADEHKPGEKHARNQKSLPDWKGDRCLIAFVEYLAVARINHVQHGVLIDVVGQEADVTI
jgi:hypothetical protein